MDGIPDSQRAPGCEEEPRSVLCPAHLHCLPSPGDHIACTSVIFFRSLQTRLNTAPSAHDSLWTGGAYQGLFSIL